MLEFAIKKLLVFQATEYLNTNELADKAKNIKELNYHKIISR